MMHCDISAQVKLGDLQEAIESFERSLEMAKIQGDEPAQSAISKALEELNERIVQGLKEREKKEEAKDASEDEEKKEEKKKEEEAIEKEEEEVKKEKKDETETYHVYVKTADERGAGTDSRVYVNLFGENSETGLQYLENSVHGGDIFEQGNTDEFILHDVLKVGEITKVKIGHDNKGAFAGWMLAHVEVEAPSLSKKLYFPCHMWLDDGEGDGKTERELEPGEIESGNKSDSD